MPSRCQPRSSGATSPPSRRHGRPWRGWTRSNRCSTPSARPPRSSLSGRPRRSIAPSRRASRSAPLPASPSASRTSSAPKASGTVSGSPAYADFVPEEDDIVVERAIAAGAVILGKTNVPEFGYSGVGHNPVFETTRNPWNPGLTSGGSSAGSGAAVASGMCPLAFGSDGGGSIRIPAAHCGLVGMKASMGRVPLYPGCRDERYPGVSGWESLEHVGPMSRTVADAALMLSVIAGPDPRDRHSLPDEGVGWVEAARAGDLRGCGSPTARTGLRGGRPRGSPGRRRGGSRLRARSRLRRRGGASRLLGSRRGVLGSGRARDGSRRHARHGREARRRDEPARGGAGHASLDRGRVQRRHDRAQAVVNAMWRFMRRYDIVLTPTLAVPPFAVHMQGPRRSMGAPYPRPPGSRSRSAQPHGAAGRLGSSRVHRRRSAGRPADHRAPSRRSHRSARRRRFRGGSAVAASRAASRRRLKETRP